jgi:hypothetical protein
VGADSDAPEEALAGSIDGFRLGLATQRAEKVSQTLTRYYFVRPNSKDVNSAAQRFRQIEAAAPDLDKQVFHSAAVFWMRKHGSSLGPLTYIPGFPLERLQPQVKPTLDAFGQFLERKKADEIAAAADADAADAADATEKFP